MWREPNTDQSILFRHANRILSRSATRIFELVKLWTFTWPYLGTVPDPPVGVEPPLVLELVGGGFGTPEPGPILEA